MKINCGVELWNPAGVVNTDVRMPIYIHTYIYYVYTIIHYVCIWKGKSPDLPVYCLNLGFTRADEGMSPT